MGEMLKCHDTDRSCKEICQIALKIVIPLPPLPLPVNLVLCGTVEAPKTEQCTVAVCLFPKAYTNTIPLTPLDHL